MTLPQAQEYWQQKLNNFSTLKLPSDYPKLPVSSFIRDREAITLNQEQSLIINQFCEQKQITLFILFLTALNILLHRYTGSEDIVIGSVFKDCYFHIDQDNQYPANLFPLRTHLSHNLTVENLLGRVSENVAEAKKYQNYSFKELIKLFNDETGDDLSSLFSVMLIFAGQENHSGESTLTDEELSEFEEYIVNCDLVFFVSQGEGQLTINCEYDAELYEPLTIKRILNHWQVLLGGLVNDSRQTITTLPLLTSREYDQLLVEWNSNDRDYPQNLCIHQLFEAQVVENPEAIALVWQGQQLTYQELNARANQLAHYLQDLGLKREELVVICMERSLEMIIAVLAVLKAGGTYVPLDPKYPGDRISYMLDQSGASILLTQESLGPFLQEYSLPIVYGDRDGHSLANYSKDNPIENVSPDNLAYSIFTSGSTGKPKAVSVTHQNLTNIYYSWEEVYDLKTRVRSHLQMANFSFDVFTGDLVRALCSGRKLVLCPYEFLLQPDKLYGLLQQENIDGAEFVPAVIRPLMEYLTSTKQTLSFMKLIVVGSDSWYLSELEQLKSLTNGDTSIVNSYGITEATIDSCYFRSTNCILSTDNMVPIGKPFHNIKTYILDDHLQPVPIGVTGELYIGGAGVAKGYLKADHLTAEKFINNPFAEGKLYKTGDLARYLGDGTIEYLGRIDNQVKIRGFRIELGEIVANLNQHPQIKENVVIPQENGQGNQYLAAYLITTPQKKPKIKDLRQFLEQNLPDFMIPSAFVFLNSFPLTANGKIDLKALPKPDGELNRPQELTAPRNDTEIKLVQIWQEVLAIEKVGIDDNFFELGGHSLLATQIIAKIYQVFKVEFPLTYLFKFPTIAESAEQLTTHLADFKATVSISPYPRHQNIPLSFPQQRLWFLEQLEDLASVYNLPYHLKIEGKLQIEILQASLQTIVDRHEALRTCFSATEGELKQIIKPSLKLDLPFIDLTDLEKTEKSQQIREIIRAEFNEPFDLTKIPLIRAKLIKDNSQSYLLIFTLHHLISDGWSMDVLREELFITYQALIEKQPNPLAALPIQYADWTIWQRQYLTGTVLEKQLNYWTTKLKDAPPLLALPTDYPRPAQQTYRGSLYSFSLTNELNEKIQSLAHHHGVTLFMTLLSAFAVLLSRYTHQKDLVIGSVIANRTKAEMESIMGFFANTLALRLNLTKQPSFLELLAQVKTLTLEAYEHQDLPFEKLVEELQPQRSLSYHPLFQVAFLLDNNLSVSQKVSGLNISTRHLEDDEQQSAKFDLTLMMQDTAQGLRGVWEYNTDLFARETMVRLTQNFLVLLEDIVNQPSIPINQLQILTSEQKQQVLVEWNDTQTDYPQDQCIHQLFEGHVNQNPQAVAIVFEEQQLTYQQLNDKANELADYLQKLGVRPNQLVGICMERSLEMVMGLLGILKSGGAYVPLDPHYPQERISYIVKDSQMEVLLTQPHLKSQFSSTEISVISWEEDVTNISRNFPPKPRTAVNSQNLAYVIYTSGSTGKPKGVQIEHRSVVNFLHSLSKNPGLTQEDRLLAVTSISFDIAGLEVYLPLSVGAKIILASQETVSNGERLVELLQTSSATIMQATPATWRMLLAANWKEKSNLKILCGGEALANSLAHQLQQRSPWICNLYGPTETTIWSSSYLIKESLDLSKSKEVTQPIGQPIDNTQIYILDSNLQPVPIGVSGEIYIGGDGLARGYLNRPVLTAAKFIPNPFDATGKSKLYKTGDLARYLPDGKIEFLGRIDNQVKIRGFRIELGEIEAILSQHPQVNEVVVIVREEQVGNKRLIAYFVSTGKTPSVRELREFLQQQLPGYMVPSAFVCLEAMPLTPNGKIDRRALPAPELSRGGDKDFQAPVTPIQEILAGIWTEILKVKAISRDDNFFELGGHSLLATQVISRIRHAFSVEVPLRLLFEAPTIAELSRQIEKAQLGGLGLSLPPIEPRDRTEPLSLSFAQSRLWFLDQLEGANATYNISGAFKLMGSLNLEVLEQSLTTIVNRHEVLRTTFKTVDGSPVQDIKAEVDFPLPVIDLSSIPAEEQTTEVQKRAEAEAQQPFNLATGPLIRGSLLKLAKESHVLLITMHHIVSDGWSMGIFLRELSALYQAYNHQEPSPLPELAIQYGDFAHWQQQWLTGETLEQQLNYWQEQLAGIPPLLELPTDYPRPAVQSFRGSSKSFQLSRELSKKIKQLSQARGTTMFMTLISAWAVLLYRYSGQEDLTIGTPIANRNHQAIEPLIGFFVNTLVMRTDLSENPQFSQLLQQVKQVALEAYAHQDIPFEKLVEELQPERNLSHSPLFQVMFVLQNAPMEELVLPGLKIAPVEYKSVIAKFDLTLSMEETESGLRGEWEYNSDLFEEETIMRMMGHFQVLLEGIVANPEESLSQLPLMTEAERHQLLVEWNNTSADYPQDKCIHQLFEEQVERTPDAIAVVYEGQQLTYRELNEKANQLAHYLQELGVKPEIFVGIFVERSLELMIGLLAILKSGGVYIPIDPTYPIGRIDYILNDSKIPIVLTQNHLKTKIPSYERQIVSLDSDWNTVEKRSKEGVKSKVTPENLAYLIYTSGSTGNPKGTMVLHRGLVNYLTWATMTYKVSQGDGCPVHSSLSFDATITSLYCPLMVGKKVIMLPTNNEIDALCNCLEWNKNLSFVKITPAHLEILNRLLSKKDVDGCARVFIVGGEALSSNTVAFWHRKAPKTSIINEYGPTETVVGCCTYEVNAQNSLGNSIPIGRPIANTQLYILDDYLKPVPIGVTGELYIGGDGVAKGYLNRVQLTAEKFIPNPFSNKPEARLYRTGDLCRYLPDGKIEYLGRIDNQVKIRGFRLELGEIEVSLSKHPQVNEAVVIVREEQVGDKRLIAYFVCTGETPSVRELREFLQQQLPGYMVPSAFVCLEAMPLTPNGKIDRQALPDPEKELIRAEDYVAPQTSIEKMLTNIWQNVLGIEKVGVNDNFFEIGGDSILSIQIVSRAREKGIQISPKQIFQYQTIGELSLVAQTAVSILGEQGLVTGSVPLTPIQHWFLEQNWSEPHHFNQSVVLQVYHEISPDLLSQSISKLLEHHDALRLRFIPSESGWQQINRGIEGTLFPVQVVDLSQIPNSEQSKTITEIANTQQASLNLSQGPLMRAILFHDGNSHDNLLVIIIHHLVVDGVSWRILLEDLFQVYQQLKAGKVGEEIKLPLKTTAFRDWAIRLQEYAESEELRQQLEYWLELPWTEVVPLPIDNHAPEQSNMVAAQDQILSTLSSEQTLALLQEVPSAYNTQINDILLTALAKTLNHWTGQSKFLLNLEGHGREDLFEDVDLSRTVGWFTSIFPVILQVSDTEEIGEIIKSVKEQLRAIPQRGVGYGILRYLNCDPEMKTQLEKLPQAQIVFNYLGQFEQNQSLATSWKFTDHNIGSNYSPDGYCSNLLSIDALVIEGKLQVSWGYNRNFYHRSTVEMLSNQYIEVLEQLIDHCLLPESGGYTPSDFAEVELNQQELDELLAEIN